MEIVNKSKGFRISKDCRIADSFLSRLRGLMFSKPRDLLIVFPRESVVRSSIHMLGMRFPIDVIWLDSKKRGVDIKKRLKPNSLKIYKSRNAARYVLELGVGKLGTTEIGDLIQIS